MGHMKKYKCPICVSTKFVIKYGYRDRVHRFFCKACKKYFSFNPHFINYKSILSDHLDGLSFRALGRKYDNGKSGIELTKKPEVVIPSFF